MSDWSFIDIVKTVVSPILGIVGGWVTASLKVATRMTLLESSISELKKKQKEDHEKLEKDHKDKVVALSSGFTLALENQKDDLEGKLLEIKVDLADLEKSYNDYTRASHHDFTNNEEFQRFTREWQHQCQKIQRTLGQIEGMVQRETLILSRRNRPDSDPSPASEKSPQTPR